MTPPAPRLDERDRALLAFAAEHRFVLAAQIARLLGVTPDAARRRLGSLQRSGLLRRERPLRHDAAAYAVTRRGLTVAGSPLGAPRRVDLASYRHDVGVAWLAAGASQGIFGALTDVVSERRMRSEDRRADRPAHVAPHGVRLGAGPRGPRLHYPDLVLVTASGRRVAIELELSTKQPARRERILAAYAADARIDAVVYLVATAAAARAIERSAARAGARDVVQVQRFRWAGDRTPGEPPAPTRQATRAPIRRSAHVEAQR